MNIPRATVAGVHAYWLVLRPRTKQSGSQRKPGLDWRCDGREARSGEIEKLKRFPRLKVICWPCGICAHGKKLKEFTGL